MYAIFELTPVVLVGTSKDLAVLRHNTGNLDLTLSLGLAVTARAPEFAEVLDEEILDDEFPTTVVLDYFVISTPSTTADDGGCSGRLLDGQSILTDILPPDVLDSTCKVLEYIHQKSESRGVLTASQAMDTLDLVLADNNVLQYSTGLKNEDGVLVTTFGLASARN